MKNNLLIIGAGHAGLLAANMLRRHAPTVVEKSPTIPRNHAALLRLRTPAVGDALGLPLRQVRVSKALYTPGRGVHKDLTPAVANRYSLKVTGEVHARSITDLEDDFRYLPPDDFTAHMASMVLDKIKLGEDAFDTVTGRTPAPPCISTLPMPVLMAQLCWPGPMPEFKHKEIHVARFRLGINCTVHQTLYCVEPFMFYRATLQDSELIMEFMQGVDPYTATDSAELLLNDLLGFKPVILQTSVTPQRYGKMVAIEEDVRRAFIAWATEHHGVYSLGRFATWRPLLLDDLVQDIKKIDLLLESDTYGRVKAANW